MPVFPDAHNTTINSSQFNDYSVNNVMSGSTGIDILLEASYPEATHDAADRKYSPRCHPGTRGQYIEDVVQWAVPAPGSTPTPIYWMKGPAGVGKSAIAQTCAEKLKDMKHLGAAFFFLLKGRDKPEKFFPSIAYQLSTIHPPYRNLLENTIRNDKTLVKKAMSSQFRYLIDEPLRELAAQGNGIGQRIAVIIDGLDECEGDDAQCDIIRIIASAVSDSTLPLCWAFFSRPEPHIEAMFRKTTVAPHCHKALLQFSCDDDEEIELYLRSAFENILQRHNTSMQSQWPSAGDMWILVSAAAGSFNYAATVIRFVDHRGLLGFRERLRDIIDTILYQRQNGPRSGVSTGRPFAEMDAFYTLILRRIPTEIFSSVHLLLALICDRGRVGAVLAANCLGWSQDKFETICNHASAVVLLRNAGEGIEFHPAINTSRAHTQANLDQSALIIIHRSVTSELGGQVSFYHKSFSDFLLDPERSGSYCVEASDALGKQYHKMHLDYNPTYHWESSELVVAPSVADSASVLSHPYTNELVNSLVKDLVYICVGGDHPKSFSVLGKYGVFDVDIDFRKRLQIESYISSKITASLPEDGRIWGYRCPFKVYVGTFIAWISLAGFDVNEFKMMVKKRLKVGLIQRYYPSFTSRLQSKLSRTLPQKQFDSALYRVGRDEKSMFWYWEIDYKLGHSRQFWTTDLAEGEKRFREEDFDLWSEFCDLR